MPLEHLEDPRPQLDASRRVYFNLVRFGDGALLVVGIGLTVSRQLAIVVGLGVHGDEEGVEVAQGDFAAEEHGVLACVWHACGI